MASFQKRGKTWQYTISRMVNGQSRPIRKSGFRTKKEAQVAAADVESDLRKGVVPHLQLEPFDEYFASWVKTFKTDITDNTLVRYRNSLQAIKEEFEGVPIQNINKRTYQAFLNEYGETHAKETTRKLNIHIRACVRNAIDEGIIRVDFTRGAVITGKEGKKKIDKYLGYDDGKKLLKTIIERLDKSMTYYLLLLALTSGMRFGEIVGLTRKDFDFVNNTISINKTWGYSANMQQGWGSTKNGEERVIKMDVETMKLFKKLFMTKPDNIKKLVFYSPQSMYHVISNGTSNKVLRGLLKDLKLKRVSLHSMRHTHASILLYEGVSFYYVSKRLGHKDLETTLNTYSHVIKEMEERDENKSTGVFEKMYV
ncbi:integrase [Lentibacillus populi]|uniref:Integrase n=1 Tax=Lentibacillus populi TaxID=1827502 RepID=A0A9W5TXZ2_9BACI|nr:tyrosine-type recombinase/integrase [Lentibacillus populi]GGB43348.1 integrase [Lentibacillus populi]